MKRRFGVAMSNIAEEFVQRCADDYCNAMERQLLSGHSSVELSEDEKFAIAVSSGVNFYLENNHFVTEKCGVAWDGEKFIVCIEKGG